MKKQIYLLYANERLSFGSCSKEYIKYKAVALIIYCKKENSIISLKYFTSIDRPNDRFYNNIQSVQNIINSGYWKLFLAAAMSALSNYFKQVDHPLKYNLIFST